MFEISWSEIVLIAVIALLVVGPKELPGLLRQMGKMIGQFKRMASDFHNQFNEAVKEAELDALKKEMDDLRQAARNTFQFEEGRIPEHTPVANYNQQEQTGQGDADAALPPTQESNPKPAPAKKTSAKTSSNTANAGTTPKKTRKTPAASGVTRTKRPTKTVENTDTTPRSHTEEKPLRAPRSRKSNTLKTAVERDA